MSAQASETRFIAEQLVKQLVGVPLPTARVALLGSTFKADLPDMRNSGVVELVAELEASGVDPIVHDPFAAPPDMRAGFGHRSVGARELYDLDMLVLAVKHHTCVRDLDGLLRNALKEGAVLVDLTGTTRRADVPTTLRYWSL
ncbi:UDP binding domain-containing protein [Kitasatospora griseola]|uniref:UDP binding domain-containing protein n=1 Tax=Kitasatospora griseola TaxID=2064 RepID=UPI003430B6EF